MNWALYISLLYIALVVVLVIGSQILHRHLSDKERRKNDVNFLKKWIFFLSFFIDFLKTTYLKKRRKKCRHVFLVKKVGAVLHTMYVNTIVCIVFCTPTYIVHRKLVKYIFCKSSSHRFFCVRWGVFSPEQLLCGLSDRNQCATHPDYLVGCHIYHGLTKIFLI